MSAFGPGPGSAATKRLLHELQLYAAAKEDGRDDVGDGGKQKQKGKRKRKQKQRRGCSGTISPERRELDGGNGGRRDVEDPSQSKFDDAAGESATHQPTTHVDDDGNGGDDEDKEACNGEDIIENLGPVSDAELDHWTAILKGPRGTAYEGGRWKLDVRIPHNYPLAPPDVRFVTRVCHPNVHLQTGEICLDLLGDAWSAAYTIAQTLTAVHQLLTDAAPDSPLNVDVAALLRDGDRVGAESLVRFYVRQFRCED